MACGNSEGGRPAEAASGQCENFHPQARRESKHLLGLYQRPRRAVWPDVEQYRCEAIALGDGFARRRLVRVAATGGRRRVKRARIAAQRLSQLEEDFRPLLISCLHECAEGRWGLFGHNDHPEVTLWFRWPEADRLKVLAQEIRSMREEDGSRNDLCDRFLTICETRGSNVPGEPKLAASFLAEIVEAERGSGALSSQRRNERVRRQPC